MAIKVHHYRIENLLEELRVKILHVLDRVFDLCIIQITDANSNKECAFCTSGTYDSVFITSHKDVVHGHLIKEILLSPSKTYDIAISYMQQQLWTYRMNKETKLSVFVEHRKVDSGGCTIPLKALYILIE